MRVNSKGATVAHYEGDGTDTQESKTDILFSNSSDPAASPQGVHKGEREETGESGSVVLNQLHYGIWQH
jgi:hypothetical protein